MSATRCQRCGRTVRDRADNDQWFAVSLTEHVCPSCQVPWERDVVAEVQVAYRVLERGGTVFVSGGRITATPSEGGRAA